MADTAQSGTSDTALDATLAWLTTAPPQDPLLDLAALRRSLRTLARSNLPGTHKLRLAEVFEPRIERSHQALLPLLLDATLPLPRALRDVTRAMNEIHSLVADTYLDQVRAAESTMASQLRRPIAEICSVTLTVLARQLMLALLAFGKAGAGFWSRAGLVYRRVAQENGVQGIAAFGRMLALASVQPESFTARELFFLRTLLERLGTSAHISTQAPENAARAFWLDTEIDLSPIAISRQPPPTDAELLYVSFAPLLPEFAGLREQLESGTPAENLGLPRNANLPDYMNVIRRAQTLWFEPPQRQFPRRRHNHDVRMCVRLGELWRILQDDSAADPEISEWRVTNKSPEGCSVILIGGNACGLIAGGSLGMRETPDGPWSICLVRWARSDAPDQIELGLELVAPRAQAVRIVSCSPDAKSVPGLLLPSMPKIGRDEAMLIARGHHDHKDFNLLVEQGGRLTLTTCRPRTVIEQTSSIEIFEFDRVRTPG